jgi:hypothetical protein
MKINNGKLYRLQRWLRKRSPLAGFLSLFLIAGGLGYEINQTRRIEDQLRNTQTIVNQIKSEQTTGSIQSHRIIDDRLFDQLQDIIADLKKIIKIVFTKEKEDETDVLLDKALAALEIAKKQYDNEPLDCYRLHTEMVELRDKADSILHVALEEPTGRPSNNPQIVVPLARIQNTAESGVKLLVAWKIPDTHPITGHRTEKMLEVFDAISKVTGELGRLIRLT